MSRRNKWISLVFTLHIDIEETQFYVSCLLLNWFCFLEFLRAILLKVAICFVTHIFLTTGTSFLSIYKRFINIIYSGSSMSREHHIQIFFILCSPESFPPV